MCGPEDPLFTSLRPLARVPFQAKESVHKAPFWENLEILASTASMFTQILAHKPPNLDIFSSLAPKFGNFPLTSPQIWKFSAHKPPFSEANVSSQAPHFGNPGRTPLPEKSRVLPPRERHCIIWNLRSQSEVGKDVIQHSQFLYWVTSFKIYVSPVENFGKVHHGVVWIFKWNYLLCD